MKEKLRIIIPTFLVVCFGIAAYFLFLPRDSFNRPNDYATVEESIASSTYKTSKTEEWTGETFLKDEKIGDINNFPKFSNEQECLNWGNNQKKMNKVDSFKCGLNCGKLIDEKDTYFLCDAEVDI